ncbi:hypothetical protein K3G39_12795 [Pontibacter sp. HSC-14F20]|nr:hypothetical protein [Pontibacter sp. HSC-14F20]MBX0334114.1 hypothetical protein [Pontibacter sp. HSC-14F20]
MGFKDDFTEIMAGVKKCFKRFSVRMAGDINNKSFAGQQSFYCLRFI